MRKSSGLLLLYSLFSVLLLVSFFDATFRTQGAGAELKLRGALVEDLGLTDLALFTEARYTRHLSQADLHSAFQDHPHAFEHFPSGSLVMPWGYE